MAELVALTDLKIKNLKPREKEYDIRDAATPGLRVRVSKAGLITFRWMAKINGKNIVKTLGRYPAMTLGKARKVLEREKVLHRHAVDGEIIQGEEQVETVEQLSRQFYEKRILPHREVPEEVERVLRLWINPVIGNRKLNTLTTKTCSAVVENCVKAGYPSRAGKVLQVLKQMLDHAAINGDIDINPASPLKAKNLGIHTNVSTRSLSAKEIKEFHLALDSHKRLSVLSKLALKILLLTAVRTNELLKAKWENVDFVNRRWIIPISDQKLTKKQKQTARPFVVPLSDQAVELFKALQAITGSKQYVLATDSKQGRLTDKVLLRAVTRMLTLKAVKDEETGEKKPRLEMEHFSPHDLRRTCRSHLGEALGVDHHIAERCLNHSLGKITATYDQGAYLEQRTDIMQRWANQVDIYCSDDEKVVSLNQGAA